MIINSRTDLLGGFLLLITTIYLAFSVTLVPASDSPTAYEMLESFAFPRGILPEGVKSYLLRPDGSFEVHLGGGGDCELKVRGGYWLSYERKITGRVGVGVLRELKGVSVKVLFLWIAIDEVVRNGGELSFYVGPLSASFPLSNFEESPLCPSAAAGANAPRSCRNLRNWCFLF